MDRSSSASQFASVAWPFDNSYARLPDRMFERRSPEPPPRPSLIRINRELAARLGLDPEWLGSPEGIEALAGGPAPQGAEPIATAYAGHQFGNFVPQLGDGRAVLLGEIVAPDGERFDVQLKGSGRTAFSRGGDGKAPMGPVLREFVVSEAMAALGVPTTRSLAAIATGETVYRDEPIPGAVLTRVAQSHIRVGTFEYFFAREDAEALRVLADHVIQRHYPEVSDSEAPYIELLLRVMERQARLVVQWQMLGFIHGVMNTDNMLISGETIDYGPCAFMDEFHSETVFSSIDHQGRYAYRNQPGIAHWNLTRLAQTLTPLFSDDENVAFEAGQKTLDRYPDLFVDAYRVAMAKKLGLSRIEPEDEELVKDLWETMEAEKSDFTLTFVRLTELADAAGPDAPDTPQLSPRFDRWLAQWHARRARDEGPVGVRAEAMRQANPWIVPRNHLVEAAIAAAIGAGDFDPFHRLVEQVTSPYRVIDPDYSAPPRPDERVHRTFCGT